MSYAAAGERYWVSRGRFFQVNRFLVDELVRIVAGERRGQLAWDLYAGVGLFSRALKSGFAEVVAVEAAADDLVKSFKGVGRRAVAATTVEFLRGAVVQRDWAAMNPRATFRDPITVDDVLGSRMIAYPFHATGLARLFLTHPPAAERVRRLEALAGYRR